jgi:hypothetical protein
MKAKGADQRNVQGLVLTDTVRCSLESSAQVKYYTRHNERGCGLSIPAWGIPKCQLLEFNKFMF